MRTGVRQVAIVLTALVSLFAPLAASADDDTLTLNLRETDIGNLIDLVSEETGTNFIVDPRVRGNVTVVSGRPVERDELMDLFLGILKVYGYAAIPGAGATRIVPDGEAKQDAVPVLEDDPPATGPGSLPEDFITQVIELRHVSASQLVPILRPLVPQGGHLAAASESNTLLVADTASNVQRVRQLVRRMDQPMTEEYDVIELEHARAESLADRVREFLSQRDDIPGRSRARIMAEPDSNALILSGSPEARLAVRGLIAQLDRHTDGGNTRVHYLQYARAEDVSELLAGIAEARESARGEDRRGGDGLHIQAHESTNAVVLLGPADLLDDLDSVIERLDVRRAQVLVEAVIAEVSAERAREIGVQWGAIGSRGAGVLSFDQGSGSILNLTAGIDNFLSGRTDTPPRLDDGLLAGGFGTTGDTHIAALLNLLESDTSSNILSTPSLLTLDNEEAEIIVGQNVPFVVGRSLEDSGQAFDTIRREDVGVKLRVRPQINRGNAVRLEIEQEVSQLAPGPAGAADLITNTRELRTHVLVDDGDMLVLGGLIEEQQQETRSQIPGLGQIPGIGRLFRADRNSSEKRNLMVFLHPRIVRDSTEGNELTSAKYSHIRAAQIRERASQRHGEGPALPAWERLTQLPPSFTEVQARHEDAAVPSVLQPTGHFDR